jgi:hypothetical protein
MSVDVDYELAGVFNGMPLEVSGKGVMNFQTGTYELVVDFPRIPMHWDPSFIIMICCDRMAGFFSKEILGARNLKSLAGDDYSIFEREFPTFRPSGAPLCRGRASSIGGLRNGKIFNRSQIISAEFFLALDEQVTEISVPTRAIVREMGGNAMLMSSVIQFSTNKDKDCYGHVSYPILMNGSRAHNLGGSGLVVTTDKMNAQITRTPQGGATCKFAVQSSVSTLVFS